MIRCLKVLKEARDFAKRELANDPANRAKWSKMFEYIGQYYQPTDRFAWSQLKPMTEEMASYSERAAKKPDFLLASEVYDMLSRLCMSSFGEESELYARRYNEMADAHRNNLLRLREANQNFEVARRAEYMPDALTFYEKAGDAYRAMGIWESAAVSYENAAHVFYEMLQFGCVPRPDTETAKYGITYGFDLAIKRLIMKSSAMEVMAVVNDGIERLENAKTLRYVSENWQPVDTHIQEISVETREIAINAFVARKDN